MIEAAQLCTPHRTVPIVGAFRGLDAALVDRYASRGAHVVATARHDRPNPLRELAAREPDAVEIEPQLDARQDAWQPEPSICSSSSPGCPLLHRALSERTSTTLTST